MNRSPRPAPPIDPARDHCLGAEPAPLTLVEYGDYECPYSRAGYRRATQLLPRFEGRLCFVFRHFPLRRIHPHAETAAQAAEAAAAQGSFWEMHDLLFRHQDALGRLELARYAEEAGLDVERFERDLDGGVWSPRVEEDAEGGRKSGVRSTPTFFVNGVLHEGGHDREVLAAALERAAGEAHR